MEAPAELLAIPAGDDTSSRVDDTPGADKEDLGG